LTASNLAAGIQEALQDDAIQYEARILGERIRAENGVEQAIELIESYLNDPEVLMQFNP
jgi:UDP:flavonoid glycosyltransferase YjiC (YdhE family)